MQTTAGMIRPIPPPPTVVRNDAPPPKTAPASNDIQKPPIPLEFNCVASEESVTAQVIPPPPPGLFKPPSRPKMTGMIRLTIRPEPDGRDHLDRDPMIRLRLFLKDALRRFGWRCVQIDPTVSIDNEQRAREDDRHE